MDRLDRLRSADRELALRLAGWTEFSWRLSIVSSVLGLLAIALTAAGPEPTGEELWRGLQVGLIVLVGTNALVFLAQRIATRVGQPDRGSVTITGFAAIGALFGAFAWAGATVAGLDSDQPVWVWVVAGAVVVAWWMTTIELGRYARARAGIERRALAQRAQSVQEVEQSSDAFSHELITTLRERLEPVGARLPETDLTHAGQTAQVLQDEVAESVRDVSHRLWQVNPEVDLRPRTSQVLSTIVNKRPFRPALLAFLYVLVDAPGLFRNASVGGASAVLLTGVGGIFLVFGVANAWMRREPQWHARIFIAAIAVMQVATLVLAPWHESIDGRPLTLAEYLLSVPLSVALIMATAGFGSWWESSQSLIRDYAAALSARESEVFAQAQASAASTRRIAQHLHGSVQSRLIAAAARMSTAAEQRDRAALEESIAAAMTALHGLDRGVRADTEDDQFDGEASNLAARVQARCAPWSEVLDIEVRIDPESVVGVGDPEQVEMIVEELLANSFRHGGATTATVDIASEAGRVTVSVHDDGTYREPGAPGLGSRFIAAASESHSVEASAHGTRVRVVLQG